MPRPRPPYLHRERNKWVVRIGHGPRRWLTARFGSREFREQYHDALTELTVHEPRKARSQTLEWLWLEYRKSMAWRKLSLATRRQRENVMLHILKDNGHVPFMDIKRKDILAGVDRRGDRPAAARHFIDTLRGVFKWACDMEHVSQDPTDGVKPPKSATDGHHTWTLAEIQKYQERWPLGTRERLAFDLIFYTGLRRGDAVRIGPDNVRDGIITLTTEKTKDVASIPILPILAETLAAGPTGKTFIIGEKGAPMRKESFGNWFREVCHETGVPGTAHGLRKALATILQEHGASMHELKSLFTWKTDHMASVYTKKANRDAGARSAGEKASAALTILFPQNRKSDTE